MPALSLRVYAHPLRYGEKELSWGCLPSPPAVNRLSYEGSRFGEHADVWHHFWFDFGVGFMGLAALLVIASVVLFVREMRRSPSAEQELTGHMERAQRPVRVGNTKAPGSSALGEIDAFTRRRPHRLASLP